MHREIAMIPAKRPAEEGTRHYLWDDVVTEEATRHIRGGFTWKPSLMFHVKHTVLRHRPAAAPSNRAQ